MTADELRQITQDYWIDTQDRVHTQAVRQYVRQLLPHELQHARSSSRIPAHPPCDWLALLVGYSWEPLLQAVCVYQPRNILLVLNDHYGDTTGPAWGTGLSEIIHELPSDLYSLASTVQIFPDPLESAGERPALIFRFLRDWFLPRLRESARTNIVLDITGAKKSMVAGAYLFGAHANVDVSYVDFDEYDPKRSRPFGYSCQVGLLANPYEAFRLRDWQRVGQLYDQYAFRAARDILRVIIESAGQQLESGSDDPLYTNDEQQAMRRLEQAISIYECWDNGDLVEAYEKCKTFRLQASEFQLPSVVSELHIRWPQADLKVGKLLEKIRALEMGGAAQEPQPAVQSLYLEDHILLSYAHDELGKIQRLIDKNEDYRSALIRSAGLHETLLKARLLQLWFTDGLILELDDRNLSLRSQLTQPVQSQVDERLTDFAGVPEMISALRWENKAKKKNYVLTLRGLEAREGQSIPTQAVMHRSEQGKLIDKFWDDKGCLDPSAFAKLRNKAAHFCLHVSSEVTKQARETAHRNLKEFEEKWRQTTDPVPSYVTEVMSWDTLCKMCGVTFLPPRIERHVS